MIGTVGRADTQHRRTVLDNGLTVVSEFMPGLRSVAIGAWVRRASVHERPGQMGVSHLLEHMVFKGTRRRTAREIALALESLGGSLDAFTSREHTSFQARVLDEHLPQAADVLGDVLFRPALRESDLALERRVVLEEIAIVEDTPDDLVFELHNAALWGDHPYGYSILGTRATISSIEAGHLRDLHGEAYRPQHIVVAAAGCVDHDQLIAVLRDTGWEGVPGGDVSIPAVPTVAPPAPTRRHVERDGAQAHIVVGTQTVRYGDPRRYAVSLIGLMLGGGMSSRLFQRVREELGLAYSVFTFQSFHREVGLQGTYVGTSPDSASEALEEIWREYDRLVREGFPPADVAAGRTQLKGQLTLSLESPASRMFRVAASELYGEPFLTLDETLTKIDEISDDDIAALCGEFFVPARQTVLTLGRTAGAS